MVFNFIDFKFYSMKRIMIIGSGGSGKSTLARQLHELTALPLHYLDTYFWLPNWVEIDKVKWQSINRDLVAQEEWIMDGNYGSSMKMRLERADTIIFLDRPAWIKIWRIIKRYFKYRNTTREDMTEGNMERLDFVFLRYIFFYNITRRPGILEKLKNLPNDKQVYILKTDKMVAEFLKEIQK